MDPAKKLAQLNKVVKRCKNAPFYQSRLTCPKLDSLADFRRLPLTTPEEIGNQYPLRMICTPWTEVSQYFESNTDVENLVPVWLTSEDFHLNIEALSRSGLGFESNDTVLVRFPYSISEFAHTLTAAAQLAGACVVPAGAHSKVSPFPRVIQLLRKLKVTILAGLPVQILWLAETAELMGFEPKKDFPDLRAICTAGEVLSPGRRRTLENIWGVPVFDHYGPDGVGTTAIACRHQRLHPLEDAFYLEILREDGQTPAEAGETGYLVVTTLKRKAMPLLRYITSDLARLIPEPCPCGAQAALEFRGRRQDRDSLGGSAPDLWDIEEIVSRLPYCRFWIARPDTQAAQHWGMTSYQGGVPALRSLEIMVEAQPKDPTGTPEKLADACKTLEADLGIRLMVKFVPPGTLYDREALLSIGVVGKPQYIYTAPEMDGHKYLQSARV